jgi:DNA-binding NarL/FixJ family response regulator
MTDNPIAVIIADDHPVISAGLMQVFAQSPHCRVVGVAPSFRALFTLLETQRADVIVLDLAGMGGQPITVVKQVRERYPQTQIVVFSSLCDLAPELLSSGVLGYVTKENMADTLVMAVQAAHAGQRFIAPVVQQYLDRSIATGYRVRLSPKELHALKLVAQGLKTVEIAAEMGIDPRCAQNHITDVRQKTGCTQRTQLAQWYRTHIGGTNPDA